MKYLLPCCLMLMISCAAVPLNQTFECYTTQDVETVAVWVTQTTGITPKVCVHTHGVIIPVTVEHVGILLVDLDMPMDDWWHLNDVMQAEGYRVLQLSWRDVEQLDKPYYTEKLRTLIMTPPAGGGWLPVPMLWDVWTYVNIDEYRSFWR